MDFEPAIGAAIIFSDQIIREMGTGKVSLIGCFQQYNLPQFMFPVPPFYITVILTNLAALPKDAPLAVAARIEHPRTGAVLGSPVVSVQFPSTPKQDELYEIMLPVAGLIFPGPETYDVVILVNNERVGKRKLQVNSITSNPQPI
jgi:hypothetical protein